MEALEFVAFGPHIVPFPRQPRGRHEAAKAAGDHVAAMRRLIWLLLIFWTVSSTAAREASSCAPHPLRILLTNDDGYEAVGIRAMGGALRDAGHQVTLIAPANNQSAQGMALTLSDVRLQKAADGIYFVTGSPATAVLLGLSTVYEGNPPDLVISGINDGANIGSGTVLSGTVGAAVTASRVASQRVPAIAVSTDRVAPREAVDSASNLQHFASVAEFVARLLPRLQVERCKTSGFWPGGVVLNINYPGNEPQNVRGVWVATQDPMPFANLLYVLKQDGSYEMKFQRTSMRRNSGVDTYFFSQGMITITPLTGDFAARGMRKSLLIQLRGLAP